MESEPGRRLTHDEQRAHLRTVFNGAGLETPRVLAGTDAADDFYVESLAQVVLHRP